MSDEAFVRITNREIWEEIIHMREEISGLKQLVPEAVENQRRIRSLELKVYGVLSGLAAVLLSLALALVNKVI